MTAATELFYSGSTDIGIREWEEIVHSLITYGNRIWVNVASHISGWEEDERVSIIRHTFGELRDCGLIAVWGFESTAGKDAQSSARILTTEEQGDLYAAVNGALLKEQGYASGAAIQGVDIERTSKIIEYRHELMNLGIANLVRAGGIVYGRRSSRPVLGGSSFYRYESIAKEYCQTLFSRFQLPPVSRLETADILELQKKAGGLRKKIDEIMQSDLVELPQPPNVIAERCSQLFGSYLSAIAGMTKERSGRAFAASTSKDAIVAASGIILPAVGILPFADRLALWLKDRAQYSFVLYMIELQQRSFRATRRPGSA